MLKFQRLGRMLIAGAAVLAFVGVIALVVSQMDAPVGEYPGQWLPSTRPVGIMVAEPRCGNKLVRGRMRHVVTDATWRPQFRGDCPCLHSYPGRKCAVTVRGETSVHSAYDSSFVPEFPGDCDCLQDNARRAIVAGFNLAKSH